MNDTVDFRMPGEDAVESGLVGHVGLIKGGALAAYQLDAVDGDLGRVVEVVDNYDIVAVLEEGEGRERANIASAAAQVSVGRTLAQRGGVR